jgi:hypothetical protein
MSGELYTDRLMLSTQAPGAQVKPFGLAININRGGMDIRRPATVGVALGMADVMTE